MSIAAVMYEFKLTFDDLKSLSAEQFMFLQEFLNWKYGEEKKAHEKAKRRGRIRRPRRR